MREILFRGKRIEDGEWVEGFLINRIAGSVAVIISDPCLDAEFSIECDFHHILPNTAGQYTGLTANGKKIFEGDILSGYFSAGVCVNGLVEFKDGSFGISWKWGDGRQFAAFTSITHSVEFEIIGNNRDNPELLEVSHE